MAINDVILARAKPAFFAGTIAEQLALESLKGCAGELSSRPMALEPDYLPSPLWGTSSSASPKNHTPSKAEYLDYQFIRIWIAPEQRLEVEKAEIFLKQLAEVSHRVGFSISGNSEGLEISLTAHTQDLGVVEGAFARTFLFAKSQRIERSPLRIKQSTSIQFREYYPQPPYSRKFTELDEFKGSPLELIACSIESIPSWSFGFFQCLFEPVAPSHNWHGNIEALTDLEYLIRLNRQGRNQQLPSGNLHQTANRLENKAHNDKPFFAVALRIGATDGYAPESLYSCLNVFQHGGRPLQWVSENMYSHLNIDPRLAIYREETHRSGFLLNSRELTGLVHLIPGQTIATRRLSIPVLETLPVLEHSSGTLIGSTNLAGETQSVEIPEAIRARGTHVVAATAMGKSTVLTQMALQDIKQGDGALFIDAHGDTVEQIAQQIPPSARERCIFLDPGNPQWIPCWNPLIPAKGADRYRMTDDFLSALENVSRDWGDRLAHILRNGLIGLSFLEGSSLSDLYNLIRRNSPESEALRKRILDCPLEEAVRRFWERDFAKDYRDTDLSSCKHKLHRLLAGGSVFKMLTQRENKIDFREIMDQGKILLVDLSTVGGETRVILGSLILTLFFMAGLSRSDVSIKKRRRFSIYADEAHLFVSTDTIEQIIAQARKFGLRLCLAHQYLKQFSSPQMDALSTMGCTIVGNIDKRDSQYLSKDLQDMVKPQALSKLRPFEMVARIGTEVVRFKTHPNPDMSDSEGYESIKKHSFENYYTCLLYTSPSPRD